MSYSVRLPMPPTTNNLFLSFVSGGRIKRVRTKRYADWAKEATPLVGLSGKGVPGPVSLRLVVHPGKDFNPKVSDLANREKAATDLLVSCGRIDGDTAQTVRRVTIELGEPAAPKSKGWVVLEIEGVDGVTPYYEDAANGIVLYHGDALEILPTLAKESVDMILTDPPYGVNYRGRRRLASARFEAIAGDDSQEVAREGLAAAWRLLRVRRHAYAFGPVGFDFPDASRPVELIWDKGMMGMGDISLPWGPAHERINFAAKIRPSEKDRESSPARLRRGSVLRFDRPNAAAVTLHPTEKPVGLLREMIESSSRMGETVLDPFAGSCRTGDAAFVEGRKAILIEIEERYCESAAARLARMANVRQDSLFAEVS